MEAAYYRNQAELYINKLCLEISNRCVGSPGNREASVFVAAAMQSFGFQVETPHAMTTSRSSIMIS